MKVLQVLHRHNWFSFLQFQWIFISIFILFLSVLFKPTLEFLWFSLSCSFYTLLILNHVYMKRSVKTCCLCLCNNIVSNYYPNLSNSSLWRRKVLVNILPFHFSPIRFLWLCSFLSTSRKRNIRRKTIQDLWRISSLICFPPQ